MSKDFPDPYRGNYNSDSYTVESGRNIYDAYNTKENSVTDHSILTNKDELSSNSEITVESDDNYYKEVHSLYTNVLNASGMNLLDPYMGYMTHFNKLQRLNVDPPYKGKTYIFITRPDLNFWEIPVGIHNVETVDLFQYFSKTNIGISVMPWLMFPDNMQLEFRNKSVTKLGSVDYYIRTTRSRVGLTTLGSLDSDKNFNNSSFTPFIPLLSNTCISSSGGQDISLETEETEGDLSGNKLQYAKGADSSFAPGEITLEFSDIYGSPVLHMMNMWVHYIHYLTKNYVKTWERYIMYRILDYTCSIYVFETDKDNSTILRWAKYTGCFPKSVPLGTIQHNIDTQPEALRQLSIPFAYNRYEAMKPATLMDFNFLMNKFILDPSEVNRQRILKMGVAPSKLLNPYENFDTLDILNRDPGIIQPSHYEFKQERESVERRIVSNDSDYYDNKFWGSLPYVSNHKLVWIDPKLMNNTFDRLHSRSVSVDSAVQKAAQNLMS